MESTRVLLLLACLATVATAAPPPRTDWKEVVSPDEAKIFADLPGEFNRMQQSVAEDTGGAPERGLHNKPHLACKGTLKVLEDIPEPYRQGFFKTPGTYTTWVRFSNGQGAQQEDRKPDLRGMAVKILDAPGDALSEEHSFDIVANNFPAQPARDINQFMAFIRDQKNIITLPFKLARDLGFSEAKRILSWAAANLGTRVPSLATCSMFTGLPLQYGPYACHIRFTPKNGDSNMVGTSDKDYLRWDFMSRLHQTMLVWDVEVQLYTDPEHTPIEDASIVWDAPYVKVAQLVLEQRDLSSDRAHLEEATGNQLSFNPWHAPKEHRPLGQLMRARRFVYPGSAKERGAILPPKN